MLTNDRVQIHEGKLQEFIRQNGGGKTWQQSLRTVAGS